MKKTIALILTLAMTLSLLSGCGGTTADTSNDTTNSSTQSTTNDNTVTEGTNIEKVDDSEKPTSVVAGSYATYYTERDATAELIPNQNPGAAWAYGWIYDTLFHSPSGDWTDITGLLVTDYEVSDDGTYWTMELAEGVYFESGVEVDASAVLLCWDYQTETSCITNFADYGANDDHSIWVQLTGPTAELMQQLASPHCSIFDYTTWQENLAAGMDAADAGTGLGSGPYRILDSQVGTSMTFVAYEDYWNTDRYPVIETIFVPIVTDAATQQTMLQSGEADCGIITDWTVMENLVENYGLNYVTETSTYRTMWINTSGRNEYLAIKEVRQALTMMIDIEEASIALSGDYGAYGLNCFNPNIPYEHEYVYDPTGALELLDSIGIDPEDIVFTAICDAGQASMYVNIQAQLALYGVTLEFAADTAFMSSGMSGEWDVWAEHGGLGTGKYCDNINNILGANAAQKVVPDAQYGDTLAALIEEARVQTSTDDMFDVLNEMCQYASENYLYLGNLAIPSWHMSNPTIVNYTLDANNQYWTPWNSWMA